MKPILFNTEMVRAILDGRKTVTRRIAKFERRIEFPNVNLYSSACEIDKYLHKKDTYCIYKRIDSCWNELTYPLNAKYIVGDILYVRETWNQLARVDKDGYTHYDELSYVYKADNTQPDLYNDNGMYMDDTHRKWKPSIHMPKDAARIFLRVKDVRVERLQDIEYHEVYREGIPSESNCGYCKNSGNCANSAINGDCFQVHSFIYLWNSTIKKSELDQYGWDANPYVFVYEFEKISKEEALDE